MKTNPLKQGILTENAVGIGTVTREMVQARAVELALIDGRSPHETTPTDFDDAKRELTGESEMDPQEAALESASEDERWDPLPGSTGTQMPESPSEDEDEEGRSDSVRLVEEGISEAEHDQMLRAAKAHPPELE